MRAEVKIGAACHKEHYKRFDCPPEYNFPLSIGQTLVHPMPSPHTNDAPKRLIHELRSDLTEIKNKGTVAEHCRNLTQRVIPFFISFDPPFDDSNLRASASFDILESFRASGFSDPLINQCNVALRTLWKNHMEKSNDYEDKSHKTRPPSLWKYREVTSLEPTVSIPNFSRHTDAEPRS